jgi:hypothetical protein
MNVDWIIEFDHTDEPRVVSAHLYIHKQKTNTLSHTHKTDIPKVDWIIQFDPPDEPKEYIHRVGRTARGTNTQGRALLLLLPQELQFLKYLRHANVELTEFEFPQNKIANIQAQVAIFLSCMFV